LRWLGIVRVKLSVLQSSGFPRISFTYTPIGAIGGYGRPNGDLDAALPFLWGNGGGKLASALARYNTTLKLGLQAFFLRPRLQISLIEPRETTDTRFGKTVSEKYPVRKFIVVKVDNKKGRVPAKECRAYLNLTKNGRPDGCRWLYDETHELIWRSGEPGQTLPQRFGEAILEVAFSQQNISLPQLQQIGDVYCGAKKADVKCHTWAATRKAHEAIEMHDEAGICQGIWRFHLLVSPEDGHGESRDILITVGDSWKDPTARLEKCACDC